MVSFRFGSDRDLGGSALPRATEARGWERAERCGAWRHRRRGLPRRDHGRRVGGRLPTCRSHLRQSLPTQRLCIHPAPAPAPAPTSRAPGRVLASRNRTPRAASDDARSLSRCCAGVAMTRAASIVCRDRPVHRGSVSTHTCWEGMRRGSGRTPKTPKQRLLCGDGECSPPARRQLPVAPSHPHQLRTT